MWPRRSATTPLTIHTPSGATPHGPVWLRFPATIHFRRWPALSCGRWVTPRRRSRFCSTDDSHRPAGNQDVSSSRLCWNHRRSKDGHRYTPHAGDTTTDLRDNTTEHLIADMERVRDHLGIDRWLLNGGSWLHLGTGVCRAIPSASVAPDKAWPDAELFAPMDSGHLASVSKRSRLLRALDEFATN